MGNDLVDVKNVSFTYRGHENIAETGTKALTRVSCSIQNGEFVVVIGRNGSGKSTLARLLNALLLPCEGTIYINGLNTQNEEHLWEIRRLAGMVFQNPDNQIVGTTVEEDVAFGAENLGVPPIEIRERVYQAIQTVGIEEYSEQAPHLLSGGQKQRVAIAGILAMKPQCIILDEATSMLDPIGRKEILHVLEKLNKDENITIIHITHAMDESIRADRVIVMDAGQVVMDGTPREVFSNVVQIKNLGLEVPQMSELFYELREEGFDLATEVMSVEEAFTALAKELSK